MGTNHNADTGQSSEYSLNPFFELSPYLLCIAGFDGYFKRINPALTNLLGYTEEELLSRPINDFIHPEDRKITSKHRVNIWAGKPLLNFENRYLTRQDKTIWLSWNSIPVKDDHLVYAIAKNITSKKKHEEQRNKILTELTKSNERLKQLNYTTAHDLRSPVVNLLSVFSLMDSSTISDPETREFIELLKQATDNLKSTLDNYIDELNDEEDRIRIEELHLPHVLEMVRKSLDSHIAQAGAEFEITFDDFETVEFNRTYLESTFLNLITNSIKYAHPDRDPRIQIKTSRTDNKKQLLFSDNGQGFDSDKQEGTIFGFRQTLHDHEDSKGIGLYLVYNHITSLGGTITVDSEINEGTTFTITFP